MARLATDGAELPPNSMMGTPSRVGATIIDMTMWRSGIASHRIEDGFAYWNFPSALAEYYFRVGFRLSSVPATVLRLYPTATTNLMVEIEVISSGEMQINIGSTLVAQYNGPILADTWYLLEVYHKDQDVNGVLTVRLDGVQIATYTGDTRAANFDVGRARFSASFGQHVWWDDIALNDTVGAEDNSWAGEGHVICISPDGNGHVSDWDGSDGNRVDNYQLVDEIPGDEDATYVESAIPSAQDYYTVPIPPNTQTGLTIKRVWLEARARDTAAAGPQVKLGMYKSSTYSLTSALSLLTSYTAIKGSALTTNPFTGQPWTRNDFSGLEIGVEVEVV